MANMSIDDLKNLIQFISLTIRPKTPPQAHNAHQQQQQQQQQQHRNQQLTINELTSSAGALAIRNLAFSLAKQLTNEKAGLAQPLVESYVKHSAQQLNTSDETPLVHGLLALQAVMADPSMLVAIITPTGASLVALSEALSSGCGVGVTPPDVIACLTRVSSLVQFIGISPPTSGDGDQKDQNQNQNQNGSILVAFLKQIWEPLCKVALACSQQPLAVHEAIVKCLKAAIRGCSKSDANTKNIFQSEFLPNLLSLIDTLFQGSRTSSYLYLASILVSDFGSSVDLTPLLSSLSTVFASQFPNPTAFVTYDDPLLVEEYFFLAERVVVGKVVGLELIGGMVRLATEQGGIRCSAKGATRAVMSFLYLASSQSEARTQRYESLRSRALPTWFSPLTRPSTARAFFKTVLIASSRLSTFCSSIVNNNKRSK